MKKLFAIALCVSMFFGLTGCGSDNKNKEPEKKEFVKENEIAKAYSDPDKYKGMYVKLSGKVFAEPENDDKGVYFQMWGDPEKNEMNTIVSYADPEFKVKADDYVILEGKIVDKFKGENAFGGSVTAIQIVADSVKISSYAEAIEPALKTIEPTGLSNSQNGVDITVTKIEFAKNETRVYYSVTNNSGSNYSFFDFNMKAIQSGKQFELKDNFNANYPSVSGDVLNGVKGEGIAAFPSLEQTNFSIHFDEGYSDNYDLSFSEINFDVIVE